MEERMARVRLIHWNEAEAAERGGRLRTWGHEVVHEVPSSSSLRQLFDSRLDAVVIDLSRMPSQGRDIAVLLRKREATRSVPIVFVGGEAEKVERTRQVIPDAVYTSWHEIEKDLETAIAARPTSPVVPGSAFAGY